MKHLLVVYMMQVILIASDIDVAALAIVHSESENMYAKKDNTNFSDDSNAFGSLYGEVTLNYDISSDFYVALGGKANYVLGEDNYNSPLYLRGKLTSDDINRAIVSEGSFNYDNGVLSASIGRMDVDFDWILGSIDGALLMLGDDESYSLRLFWLQNYYQLQYNYYMQIEDINAKEGMYGAIFKANVEDFELSLYDYYIAELRNILGLHVSYIRNNFSVNLSYTQAEALALAAYRYDEAFSNLSFEYLYKNTLFELGISQTGENGLLALIQMGSFMFGQFYLSNQVDREDAKNIYFKYIYAQEKIRFETIVGATKYNNSFVERQNDLSSAEIDLYVKYRYNPNLSIDLGAMYMYVDERDPLQPNQSLAILNLVYAYETY